MGLPAADNCLATLDEGKDLKLLEIVEEAAGGMYGPWEDKKSKMLLALCTLGFTPDTAGRGGSFGFGKAGMIRASKIRSVIAYTCFKERNDDPGVTRRLLGATYWGEYKVNDTTYLGTARLGDGSRPFENSKADEMARRLGIATRSADNPSDIGTTMLLLDPVVESEDLLAAIERYWWPALLDHSLQFHVSVSEGDDTWQARPRKCEELRAFIDAYEIATTAQDAARPDTVRRHELSTINQFTTPGVLGLVAENPGWSYPIQEENPIEKDEDEIEHCSLVALMRGPRMVVKYFNAGKQEPYIRGVFVADNTVNDELRLTEPPAHDVWQTKASDDVDERFAELAKGIEKRIKNQLNRFRNDIKPKPTPADNYHLPIFDRIMRKLLSGESKGAQPPEVGYREVSISIDSKLVAAGEKILVKGTAKFGFTEDYESKLAEVENTEGAFIKVRLRYHFLEGDELGTAAVLLIEEPEGFTCVADKLDIFQGYLRIGEKVEFTYESVEYNSNWSGKLIIDAYTAPTPDDTF